MDQAPGQGAKRGLRPGSTSRGQARFPVALALAQPGVAAREVGRVAILRLLKQVPCLNRGLWGKPPDAAPAWQLYNDEVKREPLRHLSLASGLHIEDETKASLWKLCR